MLFKMLGHLRREVAAEAFPPKLLLRHEGQQVKHPPASVGAEHTGASADECRDEQPPHVEALAHAEQSLRARGDGGSEEDVSPLEGEHRQE